MSLDCNMSVLPQEPEAPGITKNEYTLVSINKSATLALSSLSVGRFNRHKVRILQAAEYHCHSNIAGVGRFDRHKSGFSYIITSTTIIAWKRHIIFNPFPPLAINRSMSPKLLMLLNKICCIHTSLFQFKPL